MADSTQALPSALNVINVLFLRVDDLNQVLLEEIVLGVAATVLISSRGISASGANHYDSTKASKRAIDYLRHNYPHLDLGLPSTNTLPTPQQDFKTSHGSGVIAHSPMSEPDVVESHDRKGVFPAQKDSRADTKITKALKILKQFENELGTVSRITAKDIRSLAHTSRGTREWVASSALSGRFIFVDNDDGLCFMCDAYPLLSQVKDNEMAGLATAGAEMIDFDRITITGVADADRMASRSISPEQLLCGLGSTLLCRHLSNLDITDIQYLTPAFLVSVVNTLPTLRGLAVRRCILIQPLLLMKKTMLKHLLGNHKTNAIFRFDYEPDFGNKTWEITHVKDTAVTQYEAALGSLLQAVQLFYGDSTNSELGRILGHMLEPGNIFLETILRTIVCGCVEVDVEKRSDALDSLRKLFTDFRLAYIQQVRIEVDGSVPLDKDGPGTDDRGDDYHTAKTAAPKPRLPQMERVILRFLTMLAKLRHLSPEGPRSQLKHCRHAGHSNLPVDCWSDAMWNTASGDFFLRCKLCELADAFRYASMQELDTAVLYLMYQKMESSSLTVSRLEWMKDPKTRPFREVDKFPANGKQRMLAAIQLPERHGTRTPVTESSDPS